MIYIFLYIFNIIKLVCQIFKNHMMAKLDMSMFTYTIIKQL